MTNITNRCLCIFAHPDDEAFGPAGTIAKMAEEGEVFLICLTDGNDISSNTKNLARIRKKELFASAKNLGIKKSYCLGFKDGELKNNIYHQATAKVGKVIEKVRPDTLITFEMRGFSGHVDHFFCSMIASFLFQKYDYIKKIMYFAAERGVSQNMKDYFIFFPPGYSEKEVDEVVDISKYWNKKLLAINSHSSQKHDIDRVSALLKMFPKKELFFVSKK